jgi:very-short-patch-repair endonuclease
MYSIMSIPFEKSFASHEKSKFWSSKNEKNPEEVFKSSHNKYWFDCDCGHSFYSIINSITKGSWCPYCSNPSKQICNSNDCMNCYNKSFASHEKSKFWSSKNEKNPRQVFKSGTSNKYWFDCHCGHSFNSTLGNISNKQWCPYCSNPPKQVCSSDDCIQCFNKSFASHEKSKYWSSKNEKNPRQVFKSGTSNKYWFDCDCGHSFNSTLGDISNEQWCPYCSNPPKQLCDDIHCIQCYNKSCASHEKSKYWSSKNEKNPRQVFKSGTSNKYWFDCHCGHSFNSTLGNISSGSWCPYCANQKICNGINCMNCYNKSFASHEKCKYWSSKNEKKPRELFKSSRNTCIFDCDICMHSFERTLNDIISSGCWCPYCCIPTKLLCDKHDCEHCYNRSFASHPKAKQWSKKNEYQPRDVSKSSGKKCIFDCNKCDNEFTTSLDSISRGTWCPLCVNKTEAKLYEKLLPIYPSLLTQFKQDWCMKKSYLPFDFCIPECKIIIELDGAQHFRQIANWSSPEHQFENDKYKEECANQHGYSVIRLLQEDVFYDTYDWVKELCDAIEDVKSSEGTTNVYLCKNGEYDQF